MAFTDEENFYNEVLGLIGEDTLTEGDKTEKEYILCNRYYTIAMNEILCSHPWNEATKRVQLVQDSAEPIHGFDYRYALPADNLRILTINNDVDDWRVENGYIYTDTGDTPEEWTTGEVYTAGQYVSLSSVTYLCNVSNTAATATSPATDTTTWTTAGGDYAVIAIEYVYKLTTISSWSPKLRYAIALNLAIKITTSLTNDPKNKLVLIEELEKLVLPQARSVDAAQGKPKRIHQSSWIRSRY